MSKCENCLSKNVCRWYENGTGKNLCCADDFPCPEQKDKDHFIKLPCKVGDTVWLIVSLNWQRTEWKIEEGKISMIQQKADKSWKFRVTKNHSVQDYTVDKIGKTVFLAKEEAEEKLKELENEKQNTKSKM